MPKTNKTHRQRFVCWKNGFCPYCGSKGATLTAKTSNGKRTKVPAKEHIVNFHGQCSNPKCLASNNFSNATAKNWYNE